MMGPLDHANRRTGILFAALLLGLLAGGCSGPNRPPLGKVAGTVTLDGQPLAEALVVFVPEQAGRTSQAVTDASGRYELVYLGDVGGAMVGKNAVRIITATAENGGKERLPDRYHRASTLTADVTSGENTFDFALTSK